MIEAQNQDLYCRNTCLIMKVESIWFYSDTSPLCQRSLTDGSIQIVVLWKFRAVVLYHAHYPALARPPGDRRMYDSLERQYRWLHIPTDVHASESQ